MARLIVFELNEADAHFLARFRLPMFARMQNEGAFVKTQIEGWDASSDRSWRSITPWIIWPSVYTGLAPEEHGILAFGQDTSSLVGKCIWDVLAREGKRVGIMGSLLSHPPRREAAFHLPESLADDDACVPESARPLQRFFIETARNYSERVHVRDAARLTFDLVRSIRTGVKPKTAARTLAQLPIEKLASHRRADRALLQGEIIVDAFESLVREHRPDFACMHSNHVAFMQHRYWRACEPDRFARDLSVTDARFFQTPDDLARWESHFSGAIERAFQSADRMLERLARLLDPDGVLVVATALGQRPFDPARGEIHNPVMRLNHADELLDQLGCAPRVVRHQMNPDLTITFESEEDAKQCAERITRTNLFFVQSKGRQVFLELELDPKTDMRAIVPGTNRALEHFLSLSPTPDQSTAQHRGDGFLLAWSPSRKMRAAHASIDVTEVAPTLLSLFDVPPQPYMKKTRIGFIG